jgi:myosin heavy subunit
VILTIRTRLQEQQEVFKVVSAVLHLGNVQFTEDSKESANLADERDPSISGQ